MADQLPPAKPQGKSRRLYVLVLIALLAALGGYFYLRGTPAVKEAAFNPWTSPVPVHVAPAKQADFTVFAHAVGTVQPLNTVAVRSRVSGPLLRVLVEPGAAVTAGQVLAEIDPAPYQINLSQALGQQRQNLAQLKNAERELVRYRQLFKQDSLARQELDRQEAMVDQLRGTQQIDQSQVDQARLDLSYTAIRSPITGRAGMRRVDAGNLVSDTDSEGLFTLVQTQPINVSFNVPERQVVPVRQALRAGQTARADAFDRERSQVLATGALDTIDNQIDIATGTLRVKARFDNVDDALFPNQFVNIRLALDTLTHAITIPSEAIQFGSRGTYVYVIADGRAHVRVITAGPADAGRTVVTQGLAADELVVLEGLDRLEQDKAVLLVDAQTPAARAPVPAL